MSEVTPATVSMPVEAATRPFSANGKKLGVFVIAYNAEKLIQTTLSRIPEEIWNEVEVVYVVDDCSTDETTREAMKFPHHRDKLVVLRNRANRRYGGNQKFGYQYAIDRGLDAVVMLHGDGQYAPELLPDLFRPLIEENADVVIGSRMINRRDALKGGMPKYKFVGNIVLTKIENVLSGMNLSEFHSGYRGYAVRFLSRIPLWADSNEWHFDTHILFQANSAKAKIVELPIPTRYADEVCHVNGVMYGLNCIRSAILYRLHRWHIIYLNRYDLISSNMVECRKLNDPYSSHSLIVKRLKQMNLQDVRVLDLGFGCAAIASVLNKEGAILDGIDRDPSAIQESGHLFATTYQADLDCIQHIPLAEPYDIVLAADILQFLVDPSMFLSRLKKYTVKGGLLAVALPNVVNLQTRIRVLFGNFPLHHRGLLENRALHFYTLKDMKQLLIKAGWQVEQVDVTSVPLPMVFPILTRKPFLPILWVCRFFTWLFRGLFAYQGILFCRNPNEADLL